jgi:hypothetical protein
MREWTWERVRVLPALAIATIAPSLASLLGVVAVVNFLGTTIGLFVFLDGWAIPLRMLVSLLVGVALALVPGLLSAKIYRGS